MPRRTHSCIRICSLSIYSTCPRSMHRLKQRFLQKKRTWPHGHVLRRSPPSSVYVAFLLNAEQLAQDPAEQFGALYNDDLHTHTPPFSVNFGLWNNQQPRAPPRLQQASAGAGISWQPANRRRRPHKTNLYCICVSPKSSPIRFRNHGVSRVYYQHIRHAEKGADFSAVKTSIF